MDRLFLHSKKSEMFHHFVLTTKTTQPWRPRLILSQAIYIYIYHIASIPSLQGLYARIQSGS